MASERKKSFTRLGWFLLLVCALAGGAGYYYYQQSKTPHYIITFSDSRQIAPAAAVRMLEVEIGRVVSVKPLGTRVAVGIRVDREYRSLVTEASRFFLDGERGSLLIKNIRPNARPLAIGQSVAGTDSSQELRLQLETLAEEMEKLLSEEEIDQLKLEVEQSVDQALKALEGVQDSPEARRLRQTMEQLFRNLRELSAPDESIQKT
ncbi:MAG: MlaD family protein [Desulfuromonadaceae bacterium]